MPTELAELLESRAETRGFVPEFVLPEHETPLDDFRGGQRSHDVVVVGRAPAGRAAVCVEAKADEPLGPTLAEQIADVPERSRRLERLDALCQRLLGRPFDESLSALRYQLFTAAVGAAIEAERQGAELAVLVVQVFRPGTPSPASQAKRSANDQDLEAFWSTLGLSDVELGALAGPAMVGGASGRTGMPLLVGRVDSPLA